MTGSSDRGLRARRERVLARFALVFAVIIGFEMALSLAAVSLFGHIDTPQCAGTDTFCSPDGRSGATGGAVVILVGNLGAAVVLVIVAMLLVRRRVSGARP